MSWFIRCADFSNVIHAVIQCFRELQVPVQRPDSVAVKYLQGALRVYHGLSFAWPHDARQTSNSARPGFLIPAYASYSATVRFALCL